MEIILEIASVVLLSAVKFLFGVGLAIAYDLGLSTSIISTFSGGLIGAALYTFFGEKIRKVAGKLSKTKPRKTKRRRMIIRIRRAGGLWAIAGLTPILLTVPLGIFAALSLGYRSDRIMIAITASIVLWSVVLNVLYFLIGFNVREFVEGLF